MGAKKQGQGPGDRRPHILETVGGQGQTKKSRDLWTDLKPRLLGDKCPGDRQRKLEKDRNLLHPNATCGSVCRDYNKTSLTDKK